MAFSVFRLFHDEEKKSASDVDFLAADTTIK